MEKLRLIEDEKIEVIIAKWLKCEVTGDEAMSQVNKLYKEGSEEVEVVNVYAQKEQ